MKTLAWLLLLTVCWLPALAAGETLREIELTDGSTIRAEIVSLSQGMYRLRSESLGEIEIPKHRVKAIRSPGVQTAGPQTPSVHDLQQALRQDPQAMNKILSLQDDPLMQSILSDESIMQAIEAGDLGTLLNNPKMRALMDHPTVQDLGRSYGD